ncbi:MAG: VWA domain-containing protein [Planctomycetes bacterium]|nr:VWA domain-containing protein [Planctomycetota bacterium]
MNFLNPAFLWLAALAIPLIALYILKLRRRDVRISSTILWERAVRDAQANAPFQRLRSNLLLLLQLLLLALLVLAIARPALRRVASPGRVVVLVIDTSASMGARDGERTRLDRAKEAAEKVLGNLRDSDEVMVVEAWSGARVAAGLTRDHAAAERAIRLMEVRDTGTALEEALLLAATAVEKREGAVVVLFSDGAGARVPSHPVLEKALTWVRTADPADNLGITAFRAEVVSGTDGRVESRTVNGRTEHPYSVFAGVSNFSRARKKIYAALRSEGSTVAVRALDLAPGETGGASFEVMLPGEAAVEVALDEPDALAADDRAWSRVPEPAEVRVAFKGEHRFLQAFLATRPRVRVDEAAPDLWFCEGPAVEPPAGAHAVYFRPDRPVAGIAPGEEVARVKALSWDETHPLLRFAKFADVHVGKAVRLSLPPEGVNLVQGSAGPLVAMVSEKGRLRIVTAFRAADSDWPLRPSFPIFFSNVLRLVSAARASEVPPQIGAGRAARFTAGTAPVGRVTDPSGTGHALTATEAGDFVFGATEKVGLYRFEAGGSTRPFGVNLLSEAESNLAPADSLGAGASRVEAAASAGEDNRDLWPWLAGAAILILLVEWACFNRRIT